MLANVLIALLSQNSPKLPWVLPPTRIHYYISERIEPDQIRALGGTNHVVWLRVDGHVMKKSSVDALRQLQDAWVTVTAQEWDLLAQQLRAAPDIGIQVSLSGSEWTRNLEKFGPRRLSVLLETEASSDMTTLPVTQVEWSARLPLSVLDFAYLRLFRGKKLIHSKFANELRSGSCLSAKENSDVFLRVEDFEVRLMPKLGHPCGFSLRVRLHSVPSIELLQSVFSRSQRAEFEVFAQDTLQFQEALKIWKRFEALK